METGRGPLSSSSWFITFSFPPTVHSLRLRAQTPPPPGVPPGRQVFARLITSKYIAPSSSSCLPLVSLSSFICILTLLSIVQSISFPFTAFSLSFFVLCLSVLLIHPAPPFLTLYLSSCVSHQPRDIKRHASPLLYCSSHLQGRAGRRASCQGQVPSGEDPESVETLHLIWRSECGNSKGPYKELCHTWWNVWTNGGEM